MERCADQLERGSERHCAPQRRPVGEGEVQAAPQPRHLPEVEVVTEWRCGWFRLRCRRILEGLSRYRLASVGGDTMAEKSTKKSDRSLKPGDRVRARIGRRVV